MQKTLAIQSAYWETLKSRSPESAILSHMEAWQKERAEASTSGAVVRSASDETESPVGPTSLVSTEEGHGLYAKIFVDKFFGFKFPRVPTFESNFSL